MAKSVAQNNLLLAGLEPATFRLTVQRLTDCAITAFVPSSKLVDEAKTSSECYNLPTLLALVEKRAPRFPLNQ